MDNILALLLSDIQQMMLKRQEEFAIRNADGSHDPYGYRVDVFTKPLPCFVEKVLIKDGKLQCNQTAIHPPLDTSSESQKLKYKRSLEENSRVAGIYPIKVPTDQSSPLPLDYGKQDVIVNFKKFDTVIDHYDHLFSAYTPPAAMQQPGWANRIKEEWKILEQHLPGTYNLPFLNLLRHLPDTIFVRVYEPRIDLMRAAIVGPEGTPYHGGLYFFDLYFPNDYPNSPPLLRYHSGGLGIHPNLKMCGEVCFSLSDTALKALKGEQLWVPGTNILKLLICIQTLFFNPKPYFNCRVHEHMRGSFCWEFLALLYNENTIVKSLNTMAHTMNKPPMNFEDLVVGHFRKRLPDILRSCKAYMEGLHVGCLANVYNHTCSLEFKNEVASCIKPLVEAFNKIGANETQKFLHLIKEKNVVVDIYMGDGVNKKRKVDFDEDLLNKAKKLFSNTTSIKKDLCAGIVEPLVAAFKKPGANAWAKTAVDFYLHELGVQGCYIDFLCKLGIGGTHLFLERSWWGRLLGVEDNGWFRDVHIDAWITRLLMRRYFGKSRKIEEMIRWTIMPTSFSRIHLEVLTNISYQLANGESPIHAKWWEVDKVYIPVCTHNHWILVELQLPSLKTVVYDSGLGAIPEGELKNIICIRWTNLLPKYLDNISYWEKSGHQKPKEFNVTLTRNVKMPQQARNIKRGDCGVFLCMWLERVARGVDFHLPGDIDAGAFGLFFRHYMAREIYKRRILR